LRRTWVFERPGTPHWLDFRAFSHTGFSAAGQGARCFGKKTRAHPKRNPQTANGPADVAALGYFWAFQQKPAGFSARSRIAAQHVNSGTNSPTEMILPTRGTMDNPRRLGGDGKRGHPGFSAPPAQVQRHFTSRIRAFSNARTATFFGGLGDETGTAGPDVVRTFVGGPIAVRKKQATVRTLNSTTIPERGLPP